MRSRLTTLRGKLYAIIFCSFFARVVGFLLLPNTPSFLGPDEGTYGAVADWTEQGFPAKDFPLYGEGLYLSGRALFWPAAFFNQLGITPLYSVRLTAAIYGFLTLVLIIYIFLKTVDKQVAVADYVEKNSNLVVALFVVFAFLPSHFVWSLLGLRESAVEFWALSAFASLYWIFHLQKRLSLKAVLVLVAATVFTFSSRPQVGWVLGITFLIFLLANVRKKTALFLIPVVLASIVLGVSGTTVTLVPTVTPGTTATTPGIIASTSNKIINILKTAAEITVYKQQVNQLDAASVIVTQSCPRDGLALVNRPSTNFDTYFCIAWRAPYMASTFLFRPLIGLDVTSASSLFGALENILWLGAFIFIIVMLIKKRKVTFFGPLAPSLIFLTLYSIGAGSYEGNMGTAFRHKSLILWAVLLLIASIIAAGKKPIYGNEIAEKAV
ncbi:MAG: hypothetical protein Q8K48_07220 [Candidatus Planktophila sp.]|nr:hypothetical protein [Candidatus Planktophila sp.]